MSSIVNMADILLISPFIALFLFSLIPLSAKVLSGNKEVNSAGTLSISLLGIVISAGLLITFGGYEQTAFGGQLLFDGLTQVAGLIALIFTAGAMILIYENRSTQKDLFSESIFLLMSSALGLLIFISSVHLLVVFIGLELMSLSLYLLIAMSLEQKISKEAAIKYFILGGFASAIFLYGISFIFGSTGYVNIVDLIPNMSELIRSNRLFLFGIVFVILGYLFKVAAAPFHMWTPDVYQGAPTPITTYMATAVKIASFAAFLRIFSLQPLLHSQNLFDILQWLAAITMTLGNLVALVQNNFKRTLAYSSIAHSGYLLVGLIAVGISPNTAYGAAAVLFYLLTYALSSFGAFAIISLIEKSENSFISNDFLAGLSKKQPLMAFCMTVFLLSLAGLPPALGFFGKLYLFNSAVNEGLVWLALLGVVNSAISVYFYLRPIVIMYMKDGDCDIVDEDAHGTIIVVVVAAILTLILGIFSGPLFSLIEKSLG